MKQDMLTIGIAGGSASGKSSIAKFLASHFGDNVTHLIFDNYYKSHHNMTPEELDNLNYDCPDAFETELIIEHIKALQNGETVNCPIYDFVCHDRSNRYIQLKPKKILIIEGVFALYDERVTDLMDTKIFVDVEADRRFIRRLDRDTKERGRSMDNVIKQYTETVRPMHNKYVEPTKYNANIIIPEGSHNKTAIDVLVGFIRNYTNTWDINKNFGSEVFSKAELEGLDEKGLQDLD